MKKTIIITVVIIVVGIIGLAGLIQLVPYGHNHTNPPVVQEPKWDSPQTRALAVRACFDCHSNQTQWLWYTNIAPFSWLIQRDVDEGRQRLNFSNWTGAVTGEGGRRRGGTGELGEVIQRGSMPPFYYTPLHPGSALSAQEKQDLINGLAASLK